MMERWTTLGKATSVASGVQVDYRHDVSRLLERSVLEVPHNFWDRI